MSRAPPSEATGAFIRESVLTTHRNRRLMLTLSLSLLAISGGASTSQFPNNRVSGTITFQGAPLAGVSVTAFNTNTNSFTQVATTDENGNYSLQLPAWINKIGRAH